MTDLYLLAGITDTMQIVAGFMIALAYVPQIWTMKKNDSSEDVSISFLVLIWISLILMSIYAFDKYFGESAENGYWIANNFFALVITNIANFVMVTFTIMVAFKLRR